MSSLCSTLQSLNSKLLSDSESEVDDVFKFNPISPILLDYRRRHESSSSDGRSSTDRMFIPKSQDRFRSSSCDGRRHPGKPEYIHCRCCGKLKKAKVSFSDDIGDEDESDKSNLNVSGDNKSGYVRQRSESCDPSNRNEGQCHSSLKSGETDSDISLRIHSSGTELPKYTDITDNKRIRGRHRERPHGRPPPAPHPSSSSRQRHQQTQSRRRHIELRPDVSSDPTSAYPTGSHLELFSLSRPLLRHETNFVSASRSPTSDNTVDDSSDHCSETHADLPIELIPSYIPEVVPRTFRSQSLDRNPRLLTPTNSGIFENGQRKCRRRHNVTGQWSSYSVHGPLTSSDHQSDESNDVSNENALSMSNLSSKADHSINYAHNCYSVETAGPATAQEKDSMTPVTEEKHIDVSTPSQEQSANYLLESSSECLPHRSPSVQSDQSDVSINYHSCEARDKKSPQYIPHRPPKPPVKSRTSLAQKPPLPVDTANSRLKIPAGGNQRMAPEVTINLPPKPNSRILAQGYDTSEPNTPASLPPKPPPRIPNDAPPGRPPKPFKGQLQSTSYRERKAQIVQSSEPSPPLPPRGRPPRHQTDRPPDRPPKSWLQNKSTSVLATDISRLPSFSNDPHRSVTTDESIPPPLPPRCRRSQSVDSVFNRSKEGAREIPDPRRTASEGDNQKLIVEILV